MFLLLLVFDLQMKTALQNGVLAMVLPEFVRALQKPIVLKNSKMQKPDFSCFDGKQIDGLWKD